MLKKEIKFVDFNDQPQTEICYFYISKPELVELEVEYPKGFVSFLEEMLKNQNAKDMFSMIKKIVLMSYGEKSEDGKHFMKSEEIKNAFENSAIFQELIIDVMKDDASAATFLTGILPSEISAAITDQMIENAKKNIETLPATTIN